MSYLLFSDLDATLLDEETYSFEAAKPALGLLRRLQVPLVLVSSKTRSEVEELRERLDNDAPFVVENGGGIFFPVAAGRPPVEGIERQGSYYRLRLGADYTSIRRFIREFGAGLGVRGFGDMSDEEVAERTGLEPAAARRARAREFSEPFVIGEERGLGDLSEEAARRGLAVTRGGRFHHLVGVGQDKGKAVRIVARALSPELGEVRTVGLGDSVNDRPMLEVVDIPVLVPRRDGAHLELDRDNVVIAPLPGSAGWNEAVMALLGGLPAVNSSRPSAPAT